MPISAQWNTPMLILWQLTQDPPPVTLMLLCVTKQRKERRSTFWWGSANCCFPPKSQVHLSNIAFPPPGENDSPGAGDSGPGACRVVVIINDFRKVAGESGNRAAFIILSLDTCPCGCSLLHKCCTALCYGDFLIKASINENNIIADQSSYLSELIFGS